MHYRKTSLALLTCLAVPLCWAEQNDHNKPMQIEADQVVINNVERTSIFTGNVQATQGTLELHGDKIIISEDKQGNKIGLVYGSTASFRQKREGVNEYVEGYGERIEYDTQKQTIDIYGQARLKREQDFIRGEHIIYNAQSEIFQVDTGAVVRGVPPQRVRAVLQPNKPASVPAEKK
ncbi:MAG: lipopolysaccharide transport periplasmic protein LptA [Gallionella sp.]|nr:lipopolysaccharide transport periplasmic protein LptA [Gallionella sp.]